MNDDFKLTKWVLIKDHKINRGRKGHFNNNVIAIKWGFRWSAGG